MIVHRGKENHHIEVIGVIIVDLVLLPILVHDHDQGHLYRIDMTVVRQEDIQEAHHPTNVQVSSNLRSVKLQFCLRFYLDLIQLLTSKTNSKTFGPVLLMEALNQGEEEEEDPDNSLVKSILISAEEKERKSVPLESLKYGVDLLSISHGKYYNK